MKKIMTLCMVCGEGKILLGLKKRGFAEGSWNGFGGKVEEGESIEVAALREVEEEAGIVPTAMQKVGILEFSFESDPKVFEVHIFKVSSFTGEPSESEEMRPEWFDLREIPFSQMWSSDEYWFPLMLADKLFSGSFLFDRPSTADYSAKILSHDLKEVSAL
ncbi:MAG: 8-oxo-dGTP diphosphatase [Candidatus Paceibacterota bacterium]